MYIIAAYLWIALSVLLLARKTMQLEKEEERNQLIQSYMVTLQGFYQTIPPAQHPAGRRKVCCSLLG